MNAKDNPTPTPELTAILTAVNTAPTYKTAEEAEAATFAAQEQAFKEFDATVEKSDEQKDAERMQQAMEEVRRKRGAGLIDKAVADLFELIMLFLKDFFLIGQYAAISGEKTRLREMRKDARPLMPTLEQLTEMYRRDRSFKENAISILQYQGYEDEDINRFMDMAFYVPGAEDVIRFAVREVYDNSFAAKWHLDEGLDSIQANAEPDAARAGVPWDMFRKYWRAHWILPSPNQLYEMLHRGKISLDDVKRALVANDFMPGFIQPFIDISYEPLTRVDVRRMNKMGFLNKEQVKKAYRDLGYNEENAQGLADFTIADNNKPSSSKGQNEKDLTKADILKAYKYKIYSRRETVDALEQCGYDEDEANFYIEREDYNTYFDNVDVLVKAYRTAYLNGIYDRNKIVALLGHLDLPAQYTDNLLYLWDIERETRIERPTKAEIIGFYKNGTITKGQAESELANLGYNSQYIGWYLKNIKQSTTEIQGS